jgi:hypothetical protein
MKKEATAMTTQLSALDLVLRTDFARADPERARAAYERAAYDDPMWFERRLLERLSKAASFREAKIEIDKLLAERERPEAVAAKRREQERFDRVVRRAERKLTRQSA